MKQVFVLGAGRSSSALIAYLLQHSSAEGWMIHVADVNTEAVAARIGTHPNGRVLPNTFLSQPEILRQADAVISLLPPELHVQVAKQCVRYRIPFLSASYLSSEMEALHTEALKNNTIVLMECGLDPGLDHMTALQEISNIHQHDGIITGFESYCGGLIAPESDTNPWHYKISWNPRNVVLAGYPGPARYIDKGEVLEVPYNRLFETRSLITLPQLGNFEGYPNRNSEPYKQVYGLPEAKRLVRGTLRIAGFCEAWQALVYMGYTRPDIQIPANLLTLYEVSLWLLQQKGISQETFLKGLAPKVKHALEYLQIWSSQNLERAGNNAADILLSIIVKAWAMEPNDKDMVVLVHKITYQHKGIERQRMCYLVHYGNENHTAMATTVGLPLAIATKQVLQGTYKIPGVQLPVHPDLYTPILQQLNDQGISCTVTDQSI